MDLAKITLLTLVLNYGVHFGTMYAYNYFCMPHSAWEVARSLVATASPVCSSFLEIAHVTQGNYAALITVTASTAIARALTRPA